MAFIKILAGILGFKKESIEESKSKWDSLARENSNFYIFSDEGKEISDERFRDSGKRDYENSIISDSILIQYVGDLKNKIAVEIGCGTGRITEFLARDFKYVHGLDIAEEMIAQGKQRLRHLKNIALHATDGIHIPLPDNSADFVFSFIVFQHMPSTNVVEENFREIERVLVPGGIAKIQVRGAPTRRGRWFSGVSFTPEDLPSIIGNLKLLKFDGANQKYFWLWLQK